MLLGILLNVNHKIKCFSLSVLQQKEELKSKTSKNDQLDDALKKQMNFNNQLTLKCSGIERELDENVCCQ